MNRPIAKMALLGLVLLVLFSSCHVATPGSMKIAGIRMGAEPTGAYFMLNLAVAEIGLHLRTPVGLGVVTLSRNYGLMSPNIPWVPGVTIQLLPVLFRNLAQRPFIFFLHILIIRIGI